MAFWKFRCTLCNVRYLLYRQSRFVGSPILYTKQWPNFLSHFRMICFSSGWMKKRAALYHFNMNCCHLRFMAGNLSLHHLDWLKCIALFTILIKCREPGRFGAYSTTKLMQCRIDSIGVEYTYEPECDIGSCCSKRKQLEPNWNYLFTQPKQFMLKGMSRLLHLINLIMSLTAKAVFCCHLCLCLLELYQITGCQVFFHKVFNISINNWLLANHCIIAIVAVHMLKAVVEPRGELEKKIN